MIKQIGNLNRRIEILNFKYKKAQNFLKSYAYENPEMHQGYDQEEMDDRMYSQQEMMGQQQPQYQEQ